MSDRLKTVGGPAPHSTDAWFELLGDGDSKMELLDNCRPGKTTAAISALATDRYYRAFHSQGRS